MKKILITLMVFVMAVGLISCGSSKNDSKKEKKKVTKSHLILLMEIKKLIKEQVIDQEELRRSAFVYIEGFYNPKRPHSANGNLSPDGKEDWFKKQNTSLP